MVIYICPSSNIFGQPLFFEHVKRIWKATNLEQIKFENIQVKVPIDKNGKFDYTKQKEVATMYEIIEKTKQEITEYTNTIKNSKVTIVDT